MFLASTTFDVDLDSLDQKLYWLDCYYSNNNKARLHHSSPMLLKALTVSYKCPICDTDFTKQANWIQHTCIKKDVPNNATHQTAKSNAQDTEVKVIEVIQRPTGSQEATPSQESNVVFESELINHDAIDNELQKYIEV